MPQTTCPSCGAAVVIPDQSSVTSIRCQSCKKTLRLNRQSRPAIPKSAMLVDSPTAKTGTRDDKPLKETLDSSTRISQTASKGDIADAKPWFLRPIAWLLAGSGCLVLLCGGAGAVCIIFFARHADPSLSDITQPRNRVDKAELSQLLADWEKNPIAVIERHKGANVEVTGFLNEISSNIHNQTYLIISAQEKRDWKHPHMQVYLLNGNLVSQMKDHPVGSKITIQVSLDQPADKTLRCKAVKIMPPERAEPNGTPAPAPEPAKQIQTDNAPASVIPDKPREKPVATESKKLVDAKNIFKDFSQNEISGNKRYIGNLVEVKGKVWELGKKDGRAVVLLKIEEYFGVVYKGFYCVFDDDAKLDNIVVKQSEVTVKGEVADYAKRKTPPATSSLDAHPEYQEFVTLAHSKIIEIEKSSSSLKESEAKKAEAEQEAKKQPNETEEEAAARREKERQRRAELARKEREDAKAKSALRMALQLAERGFEKEARKRYQEIVDKYPETDAAAKAKKLLDKP